MPIYRGCIYEKFVTFQDRSTGEPIDITTWQFDATMKDGAGATVLAMTTAGGHFAVTDGPNGRMKIALTTAETQAMAAGPVTFGLYRTDGNRRRLGRCAEQVREQD